MAGKDKTIWLKSLANKIFRCLTGLCKLCKQHEKIRGISTIFFTKPSQVSPGRKVTYCSFVCTMGPNKTEVYRVRMTVGGDRIVAYQDIWSPSVGILDAKIHINSTISDAHKGSRYCKAYIKYFFLCSIMKINQYMHIHHWHIPTGVLIE